MTITETRRAKGAPQQLTFGMILCQGRDQRLETEEVDEMFTALVGRAKAVLSFARNAMEQPRALDKLDSLRRAAELGETFTAAAIALHESLTDETRKGVA